MNLSVFLLFLINSWHAICFKKINRNASLHIANSLPTDTVSNPNNISLNYLKSLDTSKLPEYCDFIRNEFIKLIDQTGGHFSSNLGVVELTIALHYVFNAPMDVIVWDIGHQSYIHKMLTGRLHQMNTIRQFGGLSGFCKRDESIYDVFGAGHAGTSLSAIMGIALGDAISLSTNNRNCTQNDSKQKPLPNYIAIIGDGSLAAGMAAEAVGSIAQFNLPILLVYNDNQQTSLPTGTKCQGKCLSLLVNTENGNVSAPPGWDYIGPVDGHDTILLVNFLNKVKNEGLTKPTILHITTEKGKGYPPALTKLDRMHSIKPKSLTGKPADSNKNLPLTPTYTESFSTTLAELARDDEKIACVTAAMPGGTGVGDFAEKFPARAFDVGMAEQHAVTLSAGLCISGKRPFCCIYSTFLQRAADQLIHDVFLQNLPVRFVIDRCGYVGEDGETHHGLYDMNILTALPNGIIMVPSHQNDIISMVKIAQNCDYQPSAIRLPRSQLIKSNLSKFLENLGTADLQRIKSIMIKPADENKLKASILAIGPIIHRVYDAINLIEEKNSGLSFDLVDMRFLRPLDVNMLDRLIATRDLIITVEEGAVGGFGSLVSNYVAKKSLKCGVYQVTTPPIYIATGSQSHQWRVTGLDAEGIRNQILSAVKLLT